MRVFLGGGILLLFISMPMIGLAQDFPQGGPDEPSVVLPEGQNTLTDLPGPLFDSASPEEQAFFKKAKDHFNRGNDELALSHLKDFLSNHPENPLLPDSYLLLSEIYTKRRELIRAVASLKTFLERFPDEPRILDAYIRLSDVFFQLNDLSSVYLIWEEVPGEVTAKIVIYDKLAEAYTERKEYLQALKIMMKKKDLSVDPVDSTLVQHEIALLVQEKLQEDTLLSVVRQFGSSYPADEAMIRLIALYDSNGDYFHEEVEIRRFLSLFSRHRFAAQARRLLDQIKNKIKSDRYLIAVVLPLSGRLVLFGKKALSGAQLAVELFKEALPMASVGLVVRDAEGDPSRLRLTFEDWLDEYKPIAVVGPLLSKEVNRIGPIVEKTGLPLITPGATARQLVSLGNTVYRNAVTNRFLCNAIAEYAVLHLGIERFAILYPEEQLGQRWVDCFSKTVSELDAEVVLVESYPLNSTDFTKTILRLKKADLEKDGFIEVIENEENETGPAEKIYTPGFEAIFLPADSMRAGLIIPQLSFHDFNDVRILGTNSWNTSEFLNLAGRYAEGAVFAAGFFKGSSDPIVQGFVAQYRKRFKEEPDLFSAQAFDATRLILASLRGGATTPEQVKAAIAGAIDFPGVSGFIYEILEGEVIKEPFFIEVRGGKFSQVN